jgi:hypothetical protein
MLGPSLHHVSPRFLCPSLFAMPYCAAKRGPAAQLNVSGAVRLSPPLTDETAPLAVLPDPPLTEAKSPLAAFSCPPLTEAMSPLAVFSNPPLTEERNPLAVLPTPPLTEDSSPLAVFSRPPLTEANDPLISLTKPTTKPPKLEKLSPSPTTTLWEPVRMSLQKGSFVDPEQKEGNSWRDSL